MELEKRYVPVTVHFDAGGKMRPIEIEFDETRKYHIDKILDVRRAACQSVGGVGDRYTCRIRGRESYLWFEKGRWFVAAKDGNRNEKDAGISEVTRLPFLQLHQRSFRQRSTSKFCGTVFPSVCP